ncbi:MAG: hypothetical protein E7Z70_05700 [Thermoplasmata archaeon]|nr:hypothetical protein [Thermoplasmata archaeon]
MTDIKEENVTIDGGVPLGATITYTDKSERKPAIVIIMGTGKLDRDGNGTGFKMDLYKNFARMFAEDGFVAVRYDKRGTHGSGGDFNTAGLSDITDDAISVIRYMKSLPYVDASRIIVCGHSEGSIIATLLSDKEETAGLILLGGAAMCLKDALRYQSRLAGEQIENTGGIKGKLLQKLASREKIESNQDEMFGKAAEAQGDTISIKGAKTSAKWLREHDSYSSEDLVNMLKSYGKPILAITGTADLSSDYHFLDAIQDVPGITCYVPQNVNHIFREIDDDNSIMKVKKQYVRLAAKPMHQGTKETIDSWLVQFRD